MCKNNPQEPKTQASDMVVLAQIAPSIAVTSV